MAILALGCPPTVMTEGRHEEKWRKRLTAKLLQAPQVVLTDNVRSALDAAEQEAGKLLENLPQLWAEADLSEQRRLLLTMLDAVCVDTVDEKAVVAIKPRPAFKPLFQWAATREDSGVALVCDAATIEQAFAPKPAHSAAQGGNENGPGDQFPGAGPVSNDGLRFSWRGESPTPPAYISERLPHRAGGRLIHE